jgi:hypothetical protein
LYLEDEVDHQEQECTQCSGGAGYLKAFAYGRDQH